MYYLCGVIIKQPKTKEMELTDNEKELILAIRNYKKSYPNGHPNLLFYAQQLFDELIDVNVEF